MAVETEIEKKGSGRRSFLQMGLGLVAGLGLVGAIGGIEKTINKKTVKMLTPDGKLVEIDASQIEKVISENASNEEVQNWMHNTPKL